MNYLSMEAIGILYLTSRIVHFCNRVYSVDDLHKI
jgi:hypothetical protein